MVGVGGAVETVEAVENRLDLDGVKRRVAEAGRVGVVGGCDAGGLTPLASVADAVAACFRSSSA